MSEVINVLDYPDHVLNIKEPTLVDESIESEQYFDYEPQSQYNLDTTNLIQIDINANDTYAIPSKSYIVIKGRLVRNDNNNAYDANAQIGLVNNAMMYLFSNIKYSINGTIMETITKPGFTSSILGYLSKPDDYSTSAGLKSCWSKDTTTHADSNRFVASAAAPAAGYIPQENGNYNQGFAARRGLLMSANPIGSFTFIIPFSHIFSFGEYNKAIFGVKHSLSLTRNTSDNLAISRANGVPDGKIKLSNITWRVPQVIPEVGVRSNLLKMIENKETYSISYCARNDEDINIPRGIRNFTWRLSVTSGIEKPRWIIVGFQTDKDQNQEQNPAIFDHVNLTNACVTLNSEKYPLNDFTTNFATNDYSVLYEMFDNFKTEYYGFNSLVGGTQVNFPAFKSLFPIIVFDVRRQNEYLKRGIMDIQMKFQFGDAIPDNTRAYAVIISDRLYKMESDGKNLRVVVN